MLEPTLESLPLRRAAPLPAWWGSSAMLSEWPGWDSCTHRGESLGPEWREWTQHHCEGDGVGFRDSARTASEVWLELFLEDRQQMYHFPHEELGCLELRSLTGDRISAGTPLTDVHLKCCISTSLTFYSLLVGAHGVLTRQGRGASLHHAILLPSHCFSLSKRELRLFPNPFGQSHLMQLNHQ